jgi:preprotein translocase subunit SecE
LGVRFPPGLPSINSRFKLVSQAQIEQVIEQEINNIVNIPKFVLAVALVAVGVWTFYYLPDDVPGYMRGGAVVLAVALGVGAFLTTDQGRLLLDFGKGSRAELRKMFWPTRKETIQSTGMVLVMVIILGLLLWIFDRVVYNAIYDWILGVA